MKTTSLHRKVHVLCAAFLAMLQLPVQAQNLAQDLLAYWPLDEINGAGKSPDLVGGFDMEATNLTGDNIVEGKIGNATRFDADQGTILQRIHDEGDALPLDQYENWSISMWVRGDGTDQGGASAGAGDRRVFSEGSTQNNNPLFNLGTKNDQGTDELDVFVRGQNGTLGHAFSEKPVFDNEWHHIVWVQTDNTYQLYVDGEPDNVLENGEARTESVRPMVNEGENYRINNTTIGGIRRGAVSHIYNGLIDDVASWKRALSADDVSELFENGLSSLFNPIANGMIGYWPLDELVVGKSPDVVGGFDMEATNITAENVVEGKFGQALMFDADQGTILQRIHDEGDALPLDQYENWSLSMWVRGDGTDQGGASAGAGDRRVFSEGSTQNNNPLFNLGTKNDQGTDELDVFVRGQNGTLGHAFSEKPVFDNEWHHIVWVQTDNTYQLYVDGEADNVLENGEARTESVRPMVNEGENYRINNTTIGGIRRGAVSHIYNGLIDDVAVWNRALEEEEAASLFANGTPRPFVAPLPLKIASFSAERVVVTSGEVAILRWEGSKDATYTLNGNDVTANTEFGNGLIELPLTSSTEFTLNAMRGEEIVEAKVSVAVIPPASPGWYLLGDFEPWEPGLVVENAVPYWFNPDTNPGANITEFQDNQVLSFEAMQSTVFTFLQSFEVADGETTSFFFQMYMDETDVGLHYHIGATNKALRGFTGDTDADLGGFIVVRREDGDDTGVILNPSGDDSGFEVKSGAWYNVWLDVTQSPGLDEDTISAYIAEDGDDARTELFKDAVGDRGNTVNLNLFFVASKGDNFAENGFYVDNVFVARDGVLDTNPLAPGGGLGLSITSITRDAANGNVTIEWNGREGRAYIIESSPNLNEWQELDDGVEELNFTDPTAGGLPERYYRVREG